MDAQRIEMTTRDGVRITRTAAPFDPAELGRIAALADERRGGVMSSGMEYPGRYSRWHMAYADPCAEIVATGRRVKVQVLNERGRVLLPVLRAALYRVGEPDGEDAVVVPEDDREFTEEERSRRPTVFTALREVAAAFGCEDPHLGLYGAFGYDLAFQFEPVRPRLDRLATQRDLVLHLPDEIWVLDRKREEAVRYSYEFEVGGVSTAGLSRDTAGTGGGHQTQSVRDQDVPAQPRPGRYARVVEDARERFARGDLFEVVPSHVFYGRCASPAAFYELLRRRNPAPYEFLFNLGEGEHLVGASPEMYVRVTGDRVETCPIAGTIARGEDTLEDAANIATLLGSAKEESELTMCTDVDRNDKARVCVPGSVQVIGRRQIEMYSRLIHTVDHIEGRLRPGFDAFDAFLTHMWAVTVTGAPKTWAMQFIEDHEDTPRRWYGGAVGKIGFDGSMNTGLTLRTAHITDGIAAVRAGATLLYDSVPAAEEKETQIKARALLETLDEASRIAASQATTPREAAVPPSASGDYAPRVLLVDHQDSFVHTLGDYFRQQGADVTTLRFGFSPELLDAYAPDLVVMSPGPGLGRLRLRRAARRGVRTAPADLRRLPGPAGHGGARGRHALPAARTRARQARAGPGGRGFAAGRAARRIHRRPVPQPVRPGRRGPRRVRRDRGALLARIGGRRRDGHRGPGGRAVGGAVPSRVDPDRLRPVRPPDHRQRPGPVPGAGARVLTSRAVGAM